VSQSSEFCRHSPLCCFSTSVYCCCLFRYRLSPGTFGYTLVLPYAYRRLDGSGSRFWCGAKEINPCPCQESNLSRPARSLVAILTELPQFLVCQSLTHGTLASIMAMLFLVGLGDGWGHRHPLQWVARGSPLLVGLNATPFPG
jgi:hypothetical protein